MGYTHYWTFKPIKGKAATQERAYQNAIKECQKVVREFYKQYGGLSGYTAHTDLHTYGGIKVNGKGGDMCEDFILREHFNQNERSFCKTGRYHYDDAVTACLAILKYRLKDWIDIRSDGKEQDWAMGVTFARKVLKRNIKNPIA